MSKQKSDCDGVWIVCMRCGAELPIEHSGNCTHCGKSPSMMGFELDDDPKSAKQALVEEVEFIRNHPPTCIKKFGSKRTKIARGRFDATVEWEISCKCGCSHGAVYGYQEEEDGYYQSPLSFECNKCAKTSVFFDQRLHGYNRAFDDDGDEPLVRVKGKKRLICCKKCSGKLQTVRLTFSNPSGSGVDLEDEPEYSARCQDFFDSITVRCVCKRCKKLWTLAEYECA